MNRIFDHIIHILRSPEPYYCTQYDFVGNGVRMFFELLRSVKRVADIVTSVYGPRNHIHNKRAAPSGAHSPHATVPRSIRRTDSDDRMWSHSAADDRADSSDRRSVRRCGRCDSECAAGGCRSGRTSPSSRSTSRSATRNCGNVELKGAFWSKNRREN